MEFNDFQFFHKEIKNSALLESTSKSAIVRFSTIVELVRPQAAMAASNWV